MNSLQSLLQSIGQLFSGSSEVQAAEDKITSAVYAIIGLLVLADILLFFLTLHASRRS